MKIKPGTILGEAFPVKENDCSYLSFTGGDLGHIYKVVESFKAKGKTTKLCNHLQIIYNHCEKANKDDPWIISLEHTLITSCDVCMPSEYVNRVEIVNDMLPHSDAVPLRDVEDNPVDREERLKQLIKGLDLSKINKNKQTKLSIVLLQHLNLFIFDEHEMGKIEVEKAEIPMLDMDPVRMPLYRHPEKAKEIISNMIQDMLDKDVIEKSTAIYLAPTALVNKPNGSKRPWTDFAG